MSQVARHYGVLREYLASYIQSGQGRGRISAKDRLNRLPPDQFLDVSTDLVDEIERRNANNKDVPFLPVRPDLVPKRNQARQKMATLPVDKFKELAYGIFKEIERRQPEILADYNARYGNLEDRRYDRQERQDRYERQDKYEQPERREERRPERGQVDRDERSERSQRDPSQSRRDRSRESARSREGRPSRNPSQTRKKSVDMENQGRGQEEIANLRSDYEFKIAMLEKQVKTMEMAEDDAKRLQDEVVVLDKQNQDFQLQISQLQEENKFLQDDYNEQQRAAEKIRQEAEILLEDVKKLTNQNKDLAQQLEDMRDERDRLNAITEKQMQEITDLKKELSTLKTPEPSWKKEEQSPRSPQSIPRSPMDSPAIKKTWGKSPDKPSPKESKPMLRSFEQATQQLKDASKQSPGSLVLPPMKQVLLACKTITEDAERLEDDKSIRDNDRDIIRDMKDKLSDCLTHLMSAAKQHASQSTADTALNIQDEIKLLSDAVVDLTDVMEQAETNAKRYSAPTTADTMKEEMQYNNNPPPMVMNDLRYYVEDQTDDIAHTISDLLQAMRSNNTPADELSNMINDLMNFVDNIIYETRGTLDISKDLNPDMRADCEDVLELLEDDREKMLDMADEIVKNNDKQVMQQIANSSYEVAKHAKELLSIIDA